MSQEMDILQSGANMAGTALSAALRITVLGAELGKAVGCELAIPLLQFTGRNLKNTFKKILALIVASKKETDIGRLLNKSSGQLVFFEVNTEDKDKLKRFKKTMEELKIDYAELPDLRKGDGKTQFAITPQDIKRFQLLLKNYTERKMDGTDDITIDVIDLDNYALKGYNGDEPTPELQELIDEAKKDYEKQKAKEEVKKDPKKKSDPEKTKFRSLDRALNRNTDNPGQTEYVIADAKNPEKYIHCRGTTDTYKDREYLRTYYELHNGTEIKAYDDKRFEGRMKNYWYEMKQQMLRDGGFSGEYLRFESYADYMSWASELKKTRDGSKQIDKEEFIEKAKKASDISEESFLRTISADNLICENPDGSRMFDVPERPGYAILVPADRILDENSGKSYTINIRKDETYLMIKKDEAKIDYMMYVPGDQVEKFWAGGSLKKQAEKKRNMDRNSRTMRKKTDLKKDFNGSFEEIASSIIKDDKDSKKK